MSNTEDELSQLQKKYGLLKQQYRTAQQTLERLEYREYLYRSLVNTLPKTAVFMFDHEMRYLIAEGNALSEHGFKSEDLVGNTLDDALPPERVSKLKPLYQKALDGEKVSFESVYAGHYFLTQALPVLDHSGKVFAGILLTQEITEIREAEQALRESEEKLQLVANNVPALIAYLDQEETYRFVNQQYAEMFGKAPQDMMGKRPKEVLGEVRYQQVSPYLQKVFAGEKVNFEISFFQNTEFHHGNANYLPHVEDDKVIGIFVMVHNVTSYRKAQQELEEAKEKLQIVNQNKDKFFSIIAHDLRSPLLSLRRMTEFLSSEEEQLSPEETKTFSKQVNLTASRLHDLLENLLQWSKLQADGIQYLPTAIKLHDSVQTALDLFQESLLKKNIALSVEIDPIWEVEADPDMLNSIFQNLISNAIKFTPSRGAIYIKAGLVDDDKIEVSVRDTGVGIPPETLENLFRIEYKISTVGTEGERGTGLGLILCKEFINKNDGDLRIESTLDQGTTFFLQLVSARSQQTSETASLQVKPLRILIAEDDLGQQWVTQKYITKFGYHFDTVENGLEAVQMVENNQYDVVLMDVYMPKMNGIEATQAIRSLPTKTSQPRIIALTGDDTIECKKQCFEAGMDAFCKKDISASQLQLMIENKGTPLNNA